MGSSSSDSVVVNNVAPATAEAGTSTSEFRYAFVPTISALFIAFFAVLADFGHTFTAQQQTDLLSLFAALAAAVAAVYTAFRNWRKKGTTA